MKLPKDVEERFDKKFPHLEYNEETGEPDIVHYLPDYFKSFLAEELERLSKDKDFLWATAPENLNRELPEKTIVLNGASIEVYKHSLIFNDDDTGETIGELEWTDIYRLAKEYLDP